LKFYNNSKVCSPSQGPCCTSKCSLKYGDKCRDDNGCREPSYCDGRSAICPPSVNKPNKTICNKEFVCYMGVSRKFFSFINQSDGIIGNWNFFDAWIVDMENWYDAVVILRLINRVSCCNKYYGDAVHPDYVKATENLFYFKMTSSEPRNAKCPSKTNFIHTPNLRSLNLSQSIFLSGMHGLNLSRIWIRIVSVYTRRE